MLRRLGNVNPIGNMLRWGSGHLRAPGDGTMDAATDGVALTTSSAATAGLPSLPQCWLGVALIYVLRLRAKDARASRFRLARSPSHVRFSINAGNYDDDSRHEHHNAMFSGATW